jgi:hypothetical protein
MISRTTRHASPTTRKAFTLTEMLAVMVGLGFCMCFGTVLIVTTLKAENTAEAAADRVSRRQDLARQFRDDVARAETAPDKLGDLAAGPACLILRMPNNATVVYQWQKEKNVLDRIQRIGENESHKPFRVGPKDTSIEFVRPANGLGVCTLRVGEPAGNGPARRSELSAAVGGNLR